MADFNSSLPVRTQNNGDVKVNVADGTTETQLLGVDASGRVTVKLDDGSGNAVTSQINGTQRALDVGIDVAGVQIDPRSIRALTSADVVTAIQGTTPWVENLSQVGGAAIALGQTTMAASLPVVIASNQSAIAVTNTADGSLAGGAAGTQSLAAGAIYNTTAPTLTNGQQAALQSDASGNLKVNLQTAIPAGSNAIGSVLSNLQVSNAPVTTSNPVPVTVTSATPGTPIQSYQTSAALAAGSSVTLTYTVAASHTFSLAQIYASASGKIKVTVQIGTTTIFVGFNSTANPNVNLVLQTEPIIAAAGTVNVIIVNEDLQAFDVYALIEGNQN